MRLAFDADAFRTASIAALATTRRRLAALEVRAVQSAPLPLGGIDCAPMTNRRFTRRCRQIALVSILLAPVLTGLPAAAADPATSNSETHGDLVVFPGNFEALVSANDTRPEAGGTGSRMGWHIPGRGYLAGDGWWALVCGNEASATLEQGCVLHGTHLSVTPAMHSVYDGDPVASQLLHWSPLPANLDKAAQDNEKRPALVAVFKPIRSLAGMKLMAGPVATYVHPGMSRYPGTGRPGTLEVRLTMADGKHLDIVPRVAKSPPGEPSPLVNITTFELRQGALRQRLPGYEFSEIGDDGSLSPQQYLLWAGDLDGDGKPDLIINHGGYGTNIAVYLSSLAKEGELVGFAGNFQYSDPSAAGC